VFKLVEKNEKNEKASEKVKKNVKIKK